MIWKFPPRPFMVPFLSYPSRSLYLCAAFPPLSTPTPSWPTLFPICCPLNS